MRIFQELESRSCHGHKVMILATALTVNFLVRAAGGPSCGLCSPLLLNIARTCNDIDTSGIVKKHSKVLESFLSSLLLLPLLPADGFLPYFENTRQPL